MDLILSLTYFMKGVFIVYKLMMLEVGPLSFKFLYTGGISSGLTFLGLFFQLSENRVTWESDES